MASNGSYHHATARPLVSVQDQRPGRILVVDDVEANRTLVTRFLKPDGYDLVFASDGRAALDAVARMLPDLVLMDIQMPELDGFETCRILKRDNATRFVPVVLVTARLDAADRIRGIDAGADDFLTKPFNEPELRARVRSLIRLKRYTDDFDTAESVILSLALTIEARDECTQGHCERLVGYAGAMGSHLGLSEDELAALTRGAYLHDIGKVGVPDAVLLKPGRLTPSEFAQMKQHTIIGDRLCGELRSLRSVRPIVRHHHERCDGSGYPDGLRSDAIPLVAQITGIVDVFDALTNERPYKAPYSVDEACKELRREVDCGWRRADLVGAFIELVESGDLGRVPEEAAASCDRLQGHEHRRTFDTTGHRP